MDLKLIPHETRAQELPSDTSLDVFSSRDNRVKLWEEGFGLWLCWCRKEREGPKAVVEEHGEWRGEGKRVSRSFHRCPHLTPLEWIQERLGTAVVQVGRTRTEKSLPRDGRAHGGQVKGHGFSWLFIRDGSRRL